MAHHLTPAELADQLQMERQEVIGKCVADGGADLPRPDRQDALRNLAAQPRPRRRRRQARPGRGAELDSPGRCRGEVPTRRRSPTCCRRRRSMYGSHVAVRYKEGDAWVEPQLRRGAGDRPAARLRPGRRSGSRRATASRSSATPAPSGPTSTSPRSRSAPPSSRSTRPTRPRSAATSSRTPTPRSSSSRTPNSWRRCAQVRDQLPQLEHVVLMTGSAEDAISMEDLAAKGGGGDDADLGGALRGGHPGGHLHLHLHLRHDRAAEGLHHQPRQLPGDARHGQRGQRHRRRRPHLPLPPPRPLLRPADPARQLRPRHHDRLLGAGPAEDPAQPGRTETDLLPLGAAHLREDLHRRDQRDGERGRPQKGDLRLVDQGRREDARGRTRRPQARLPAAAPVRLRRQESAVENPRPLRRQHPPRRLRRRPDQPGDPALLRRRRRPRARGLGDDRDLDRGDDLHARGLQGRHDRQAVPRLRGEDRRRRRDPRQGPERLPGLPQEPGGDRARRSSTAGSTPATSARSTPTASSRSPAAKRTSSSPRAARTSPPPTSRPKSSSTRWSPSASSSATAAPTWSRWSPSTPKRRSPTPRSTTSPRTRPSSPQNPDVKAAIEAHVEKINQNFARVEQVKKIAILPHDLSQESGELTPTLKVKRAVVAQKHEDADRAALRGVAAAGRNLDGRGVGGAPAGSTSAVRSRALLSPEGAWLASMPSTSAGAPPTPPIQREVAELDRLPRAR